MALLSASSFAISSFLFNSAISILIASGFNFSLDLLLNNFLGKFDAKNPYFKPLLF